MILGISCLLQPAQPAAFFSVKEMKWKTSLSVRGSSSVRRSKCMLEGQPEEASLTVALAIYAQRLSVSFGSLNKQHFQCKQFKRKRFGVQAQLAREGSNCRAVLGCTHAGLADLFLAMINKTFDLTQSSVPALFRDYHCKGPTCITPQLQSPTSLCSESKEVCIWDCEDGICFHYEAPGSCKTSNN